MERRCPICHSPELQPFLRYDNVPAFCNIQHPDAHRAKTCSRGDIHLAVCSQCGFIQNIRFDDTLMSYSQHYENSLHYSPVFQSYAETLATDLIARYDLYHKTIVDIGCGRGDFLRFLCQKGHNRGYGFDPSLSKEIRAEPTDQLTLIPDIYSTKYSRLQAHVFCGRHVLEHLADPSQLLHAIQYSINGTSTAAVYFEVPNSEYTFTHPAIWDIIYEHPSYFTSSSLYDTFSKCGFHVDEIVHTYKDQYLGIYAHVDSSKQQKIHNRAERSRALFDLSNFQQRVEHIINQWNQNLKTFQKNDLHVILWGAGSKGVMFLNLVETARAIDVVVDINTHKQGRFLPGTGHQIVSPSQLAKLAVDVVIVANPIYKQEVKSLLISMGHNAPVFSF